MKLSKNSNVLILSHFYKRTLKGGGPPQEIRNYFLPRVNLISYIEHPFPYSDDHRSSLSIYKNGKLEKQIFSFPVYGPGWIYYIMDFIFTAYFFLRVPLVYELCIALDNLNVVSILLFKKLGLIKKLVFYTIDYTPTRFVNKILNSTYHFLDRVACYNSDVIWVLSDIMLKKRTENGVNPKKSAKSILLPMGANLEIIKPLPFEKIKRHQIVFMGVLIEKQGLQMGLETLPLVIEKVPDAKLLVIGKGEYEKELRKIAKNNNISTHVEFKGFIEKQSDVEKLLLESSVGLATYVPFPDSYTYFTDPGKPKFYMACGLPVVITNVPAIAKEIKIRKAGIVVDYTKESIAKALITLLSDDSLYKEYRKNAIKLSKNYDTNTMIGRALKQT